ncbi:hypothetical protein [Nocardia arthritidis]|uniref:Thioredoxin domain-containing protein n=1 Tax=Nocardia arthritidis TaxID=228602 RepID=A0A6G9Y4E2_9NOCA|nr:hypothetical protein [Nocardia arthritidis]QIS07980.1 hypothetical protein F5544_00225 [Nocardia arthritidis]
MTFLLCGVVLVGLLCALDLLLTVGVIKRLREHTDLLSNRDRAPMIGVGEEIGEFEASTVDGERLSTELLGDETLVAFFSPSCGPCKEKLPKFVAYARAAEIPRPVAVVVGAAHEAEEFVAALRPVARVVVESADGAMGTAFRAQAYPTVLKVGPDRWGKLVVQANRVDLDQPALTRS